MASKSTSVETKVVKCFLQHGDDWHRECQVDPEGGLSRVWCSTHGSQYPCELFVGDSDEAECGKCCAERVRWVTVQSSGNKR